mgnify:CR=1 FL=1
MSIKDEVYNNLGNFLNSYFLELRAKTPIDEKEINGKSDDCIVTSITMEPFTRRSGSRHYQITLIHKSKTPNQSNPMIKIN